MEKILKWKVCRNFYFHSVALYPSLLLSILIISFKFFWLWVFYKVPSVFVVPNWQDFTVVLELAAIWQACLLSSLHICFESESEETSHYVTEQKEPGPSINARTRHFEKAGYKKEFKLSVETVTSWNRCQWWRILIFC